MPVNFEKTFVKVTPALKTKRPAFAAGRCTVLLTGFVLEPLFPVDSYEWPMNEVDVVNCKAQVVGTIAGVVSSGNTIEQTYWQPGN